MEITVKKSRDYTVSEWSGGTTTELAIYPSGSSYRDRNFLWRLSSAAVREEESVFTKLNGYRRILMVAEGEITLSHTGQYEKKLGRFGQDTFMGAWETVSHGRAADVNLMLGDGCEGLLRHISLAPGESIEMIFPENAAERRFELLFPIEGKITVTAGEKRCGIQNRGLFFAGEMGEIHISLQNDAQEKAEIVGAAVWVKR